MSLQLNPAVPEGEKILRPRSPKEILELLSLVSEGNKKIDEGLKGIEESSERIAKEIDFNQAKLNNLQAPQKTESAIALNISAENQGQVDLEVSYQVGQASWRPSYNLNETKEKFSLDTFAVINQRSGEDWKNVKLTLSTARPQIRLERPYPTPYFLDILRPVAPASAQGVNESVLGFADKMSYRNLGSESGGEDLYKAKSPILSPDAEINMGAVVTYNIPHLVSLKSDGTAEKVKVSTTKFEGQIGNVAVPAQSLDVFREALLKNTSDLPILPGTMNIFSEARFLGTKAIGFTQAGEEIRTPVGASQNITVKRTLLKKFEDDSGIVRSVRRIRHDYLIEVVNNSSDGQKAVVLEPAPNSRNENIIVSIDDVSPAPLNKDNTERLIKQDGVIEWHLDLKGKAKQTIKYSTVIEFPADTLVSGIERL